MSTLVDYSDISCMNIEELLKEYKQSQEFILSKTKKELQQLIDFLVGQEYSDQIFFVEELVIFLEERILVEKKADIFFKDEYIQKLLRDIVS